MTRPLSADNGSPIRRARKRRKLSQGALATMSGVPQPTIARLEERREIDPRLSTAVGLSLALDVTIDALFPHLYKGVSR